LRRGPIFRRCDVTKLVVRLSQDRLALVRAAAEREGISLADVARLALNEWLDDHPARAAAEQRSAAA
jgi:hypothetical protein